MENTLLSFNVPSKDDSLDVWKAFINDADWRVIRDIKQDFIPRSDDSQREHDKEISRLMAVRLFQLELPVFDPEFWDKKWMRVFFVEDGISREELKAQIAAKSDFSHPHYVVEKSGKLRGFALTKNLILVGCTVSRVKARWMVSAMCENHRVDMLTFGESVVVKLFFDELCDMMEMVNVPSLRDVSYWMLSSLDRLCSGCYAIFSPHGQNCMGQIEFDDASCLVAKL